MAARRIGTSCNCSMRSRSRSQNWRLGCPTTSNRCRQCDHSAAPTGSSTSHSPRASSCSFRPRAAIVRCPRTIGRRIRQGCGGRRSPAIAVHGGGDDDAAGSAWKSDRALARIPISPPTGTLVRHWPSCSSRHRLTSSAYQKGLFSRSIAISRNEKADIATSTARRARTIATRSTQPSLASPARNHMAA